MCGVASSSAPDFRLSENEGLGGYLAGIGKTAEKLAKRGPLLGYPSAPAVGKFLGVDIAAGGCTTEARRRVAPKSNQNRI